MRYYNTILEHILKYLTLHCSIYSKEIVSVLEIKLICRILHSFLDFQIKDLTSITLVGCKDRS